MTSHPRRVLAVVLLALVSGGCGGGDQALSSPIMVEAEHSHYHVHAADAAHEHTHADDTASGGHAHSHQHAEE